MKPLKPDSGKFTSDEQVDFEEWVEEEDENMAESDRDDYAQKE